MLLSHCITLNSVVFNTIHRHISIDQQLQQFIARRCKCLTIVFQLFSQ